MPDNRSNSSSNNRDSNNREIKMGTKTIPTKKISSPNLKICGSD